MSAVINVALILLAFVLGRWSKRNRG